MLTAEFREGHNSVMLWVSRHWREIQLLYSKDFRHTTLSNRSMLHRSVQSLRYWGAIWRIKYSRSWIFWLPKCMGTTWRQQLVIVTNCPQKKFSWDCKNSCCHIAGFCNKRIVTISDNYSIGVSMADSHEMRSLDNDQVCVGQGVPWPAGRPLPRNEVLEAGRLPVQRRHGNRRHFEGNIFSFHVYFY